MLDEKLSTDYRKGQLYDELLTLADQEFDLISQALVLPAAIRPYFEGEKEPETEMEARKYRDLFMEWADKALQAIKAHPTAENLEKFFTILPESVRQSLQKVLLGAIAEQKGA